MLSVIMPAYNEAGTLGHCLQVLATALEGLKEDYEVIVVDDGSVDGTFAVAQATARRIDRIRVVGYSTNQGKGFAIKHGFQFSRGDPVLFLDADGDLPPGQIPGLADLMARTCPDVLIGSKLHPESIVKYPLSRRLMSYCYRMLVRATLGLKVTDTQVGLKIYRRRVLNRILPGTSVKRYAFDVELLAAAHGMGFTIAEAPVELTYKFRSRIGLGQVLTMLGDTLGVWYRVALRGDYREVAFQPVGEREDNEGHAFARKA